MGQPSPPSQVQRMLVAFSRHDAALAWARRRAEEAWGPIELASPRFAFDETDYYTAEMGPRLSLEIWAFERLADSGELADWKRQAGAWEAEFAAEFAAACARQSGPIAPPLDGGETRPLNLDPGYLTLAKFVLASTKDHAHRIYLRDGVFAEVTLYYSGGRWREHLWTYPNYRRQDYQAFLSASRQRLLARRKDRDG